MVRWQILLVSILVIGGLGGVMAIANPDRSAYETYGVEQLGELAKGECDRAPGGFGLILQEPCRAAIESFKPQLRPMLAQATTRQNFIIFSIYRSEISIPVANFNAKVESIGIFNNFYTYRSK